MLACPNCRTIQPPETINTGRMRPCPGCGVAIRSDVYNAFARKNDPVAASQSPTALGQAECFYHPGKTAVVPCADCGRLLCPVCRVEMDDRSICMNCLQAGRDKQKITALQNESLLYDSLAFHLAFWPMSMIFPTLLTAPAAIYFCIKHWRRPQGVLPKGWFKNILALLLAVGQVIGWILFLVERIGS